MQTIHRSRFIIIAFFVFCTHGTSAQKTIFGTTATYGSKPGSIYKIQMDGTGFEVHHEWNSVGDWPSNFLVLSAENETYLGSCSSGGEHGAGTIFKYSAANNKYEVLANLNESTGSRVAGLLPFGENTYYGVTTSGGLYNHGTLFKFDLTQKSLTKLVDFRTETGTSPGHGFAVDGQLLYITMGRGGNTNMGSICKFDTETAQYSMIYSFSNSFSFPEDVLVDGANGKYYGLATEGEDYPNGAIFSLEKGTGAVEVAHAFDGASGKFPAYGTMSSYEDKLIGVTYSGGLSDDGLIFSFDPNSSEYVNLFNFDEEETTIGGHPGPFKIFGTKLIGQSYHMGTSYPLMFEFDLETSEFQDVYDFGDARTYSGGFILQQLSENKFLGVMNQLLFELDTETKALTEHFNFTDYMGETPVGSLVLTNDGIFYGVTSKGGNDGKGTIFAIDPNTFAFKKGYDFNSQGIHSPSNCLTMLNSGLMIGTTSKGGAHGRGVIYSFDVKTQAVSVLHDFGENFSYYLPESLVYDADRHVYGIVRKIDTDSHVLFSFAPDNGSFVPLVAFDGPNGRSPEASPMYSPTYGKLFGLTSRGGDDDVGVLYSFDLETQEYHVEKHFSSTVGGKYPEGIPAESNGLIYFLTDHNAFNPRDLFYRFDPTTNSISGTTNFSANESTGHFAVFENQLFGLIQSENGLLFRHTVNGGYKLLKELTGSHVGKGPVSFYNYAPMAVSMPELTLQEDMLLTFDLEGYFLDVEDSVSEFQYSVDSIKSQHLLDTIIFLSGSVQVLPKENVFGEGEVFFKATDRGGKTVNNSFTFKINAVPDPPQLQLDSGQYGDGRMPRIIIQQNAVDGPEVTHFRIDSFVNLKVYNQSGAPLMSGDTIRAMDGNLSLSYEIVDAGPIQLVVSGVSASTGLVAGESSEAVSFVTKATLILKAIDAYKRAGEPDPAFLIDYIGFLYDDDINDIDQLPGAYTTTWEDVPGEYPIMVNGGADNNYEFEYQAGVLTIIGPTTGITPPEFDWEIFPVPAYGQLTLKASQTYENLKTFTCIISDLTGKILMQEGFSASTHQIDIRGFATGIYLIAIEDAPGHTVVRKKLIVK